MDVGTDKHDVVLIYESGHFSPESNDGSTKIANKPVIKIQFNDKEGKNELTDYAMSVEASYGDVDLTKNQDVLEQIEKVKADGYNVTKPDNEEKVSVDAPEVTVIYTVEGMVYVKSVPTEIQFEKITYDATIKRPEIIDYRERLIVRDTRFNKASGWTLSAKVSKPMTNESDGVTLDSSLRYVDSNKEEKILSDENTDIVNNQKQESEYDVTNDWNDYNGLKLVVDPKLTTVTKGNYEGEITWEVTSAP